MPSQVRTTTRLAADTARDDIGFSARWRQRASVANSTRDSSSGAVSGARPNRAADAPAGRPHEALDLIGLLGPEVDLAEAEAVEQPQLGELVGAGADLLQPVGQHRAPLDRGRRQQALDRQQRRAGLERVPLGR